MGISIGVSSDSRDYYDSINDEPNEKIIRSLSTPNPKNFKIIHQEIINGYPILVIHYPDVLNYEGIKVLVYEKNFDLDKIKDRIDPHFFDKGDSPIARFVPTDEGIEMARVLVRNLK